MSKERKISVAKALTAQLHATEEAIDTALAEAANLIEAYVTSRRAIRMSTIVGNDVHYNTLQAMMALSTAQRHMTAAHAYLTKVQHQVGLGAVAIVPVDDKPPPKQTGVMPAHEDEAA
jgi:phage gp36-like protein